MIPFLDLDAQYANLKELMDAKIAEVVASRNFILGPYVEAFEKEFAAYQGVADCVGVSNGTSAVFLALQALGVGPGDEVITVPNTFIATTEMISKTGASFVFVDVNEYKVMDPSLLEAAITPKTKAIVPVHLHGQLCDMPAIMAVAKKHGLVVVEDAAQAHGALFAGKKAGQFGDCATFSFFPGKNLGAYGDAGAIVTNDAALASRLRQLRNHGRALDKKYEHDFEGYNERMDGLQAAVLSVKLPFLDEWNAARRKVAAKYDALLKDLVALPLIPTDAVSVFHIYPICLERREGLLSFLKEKKIGTGVHYPIPLHLQPAYAHLNLKKGSFPVAEQFCEKMVSLPIFPEMSDDQVQEVVAAIKEFMGTSSSL